MSLENIRLVILDVDGVLTDGTLWYSAKGEEIKPFNVKDGYGIKSLQRNGIKVGIITGRESKALEQRAKGLKIDYLYQGVSNKLIPYEEILKKENLSDKDIAYMGDDIPDICILKRVDTAATPADGVEEVKNIANFIARNYGGHGAVRELAEAILKAQGKW
jgi:3-deoxy-D-manno-octulosonate 8-phosphate phosphatase (KDO 8-P phosphatase)